MARRPTKKAQSEAASKLAEALNFVYPSYKEGGQPFEAHARLAGKTIAATNGVFSAGTAVEEELALCPHIGRLIDALNRSGKSLAITENENGSLLVKGDKIRATVPCIPGDLIPAVMPDPNIAAIDNTIAEGFAKLLPLLKTEAERVIEVSILLQANSMFACNGTVIFEFWHGIDLPPGLVLPKDFAVAVVAVTKLIAKKKALTGFGFSDKSVTFWFDDGSWYKTQQYGEQWPSVGQLFDFPMFAAPVHEGLFEAVRAIESFSNDGLVHFHEDKLKTTYDKYQSAAGPIYGATYDVPGLQAGHSFTAKLLRLIESVCVSIDYTSNDDRAFFFDGGSLRGSIMKARVAPSDPAPAPQEYDAAWVAEQPQEPATAGAGGGWGPVANEVVQSHAEPPQDAPADPWAGIVTGPGYDAPTDDDIPF